MIRNILQKSLKILATAIIRKYSPDIIAITGSVGKTTTKEACFTVLSQKYRVRRSLKNYNTEIGIPLAVIGASQPPNRSIIRWLFVGLKAVGLILIRSGRYPRILILELAADHPGDISYFMEFIKPKVSIITTLSPVHLANFSKFSQIVAEKRQIIEQLEPDGYAVLNYDDEEVKQAGEKTVAKIISYGLETSQVNIQAQENRVIVKAGELGLFFKLMHQGTVTPVFVKGLVADQQVYSLLAAAACGIIYHLTSLEIAHGLESFTPLSGRFELRQTPAGYWVIDDTYNAAPASVCAALSALANLPLAERKIAVLGDMLELGGESLSAHQSVGQCAVESGIDAVLFLGEQMKAALAMVQKSGARPQIIKHFNDQPALIKYLKKIIRPQDAVLVKGSHAMAMDQIVTDLMSA